MVAVCASFKLIHQTINYIEWCLFDRFNITWNELPHRIVNLSTFWLFLFLVSQRNALNLHKPINKFECSNCVRWLSTQYQFCLQFRRVRQIPLMPRVHISDHSIGTLLWYPHSDECKSIQNWLDTMGAIEFMNIVGIFDGQARDRQVSEYVKDFMCCS